MVESFMGPTGHTMDCLVLIKYRWRGVEGFWPSSQILADVLTPNQGGGQIMPATLVLPRPPLDFQTFLHTCGKQNISSLEKNYAGVYRRSIFKIRPNILIGLQKLRLRPKGRSRLFIYFIFLRRFSLYPISTIVSLVVEF